MQWATEKDAAELGIQAITREGAEDGGDFVLFFLGE